MGKRACLREHRISRRSFCELLAAVSAAGFAPELLADIANGGCGLNLNIQSVEELKDAQLHPEKYENLQVRVAGWNIRWNDIPKTEQDGFIRRLEAMPR